MDDFEINSEVNGDQEFPIPAAKYLASLVGTDDEIWSTLIRINHGRENHYLADWQAIVDSYRSLPAH